MNSGVQTIRNPAEALEDEPIVREVLGLLGEIAGRNKTGLPRLYGWSLTIALRRSDQRLLPAEADNALSVGTLRENISEKTVSLTLYVRQGDPESMGLASLTIDSLRPLRDQLEEGLVAAATNNNPPWVLPGPPAEDFPHVRTVDDRLLENPAAVTEELAREADRVARELEGVKVNCAELFVNTNLRLTLTSTGLRLPRAGSDLYFEVAMEKLPLPNTQEVHNYRKSLDADGLDLPNFLRETAAETRALDEVEMPFTTENAVVLLYAPEINRILHGLLDQCEAAREYNRLPHLAVGENVAGDEGEGPRGEALTLRLDPLLDLMAETTAFTGEGLPARGGVLIEAGVVRAQKISQRMGEYLERMPNGLCGNIVLDAGKATTEELLADADQVVEILSFSSLLVNPDQLTWSSEIKLGRLHERRPEGTRTTLLKGGIVSGNIRENLRDSRWSKERTRHNSTADIFSGAEGYYGPAAWLIKSGATISGRDGT